MDDDTHAAARHGLARIEAAVAAMPADELAALRAVAAMTDGDVEGFAMPGSFSVLGSSDGLAGDDMFTVMMAYQKMANNEARQDRKSAPASAYPTTRHRRPFP